MSKYRVEVVPSRLKIILLVTLWGLVLLSVFHWQADIFPYQQLLQTCFALITLLLAYRNLQNAAKSLPFSISFSQQGEWNYLDKEMQFQWQITEKSKLSSWLVWLQLRSPVDPNQGHWLVIFKDQVSEADYRRLCRAILYQQQTKSNN